MWYPNMGPDYTNRDSIRKEMQERIEVFAALPKLDHLFVPGGPRRSGAGCAFWMVRQSSRGVASVPSECQNMGFAAGISPRSEMVQRFFRHVNSGYPRFGGVVLGFWVKIPLPSSGSG